MHAVFTTGGKQFRVSPGDEIKIERLTGNEGDEVVFDKVLLTSDGETVNIGKPYLEKSKITARILRQGRDRKIVVFKFKKRKNYKKKQGHRQNFTLVKIENIH
jgi:large subunit ribosomal protein L21